MEANSELQKIDSRIDTFHQQHIEETGEAEEGQHQKAQSQQRLGVTIEDALRHAGGFGLWQFKAVCGFQCSIMCGSLALYPMSFFEMKPEYECLEEANELNSEESWKTCKPEEFCVEENEVQYRVNEEAQTSLKNWVEEYGMDCA